MLFFLFFACEPTPRDLAETGPLPTEPPVDVSSADSASTDSADSASTEPADSTDVSDPDSGATEPDVVPVEACPGVDRWTDNAAFPVGETITWSLSGCGVPLHLDCADADVAQPSFSGTLADGTFTWSVTALHVGATTCTLTLADPRDDDRVDFVAAIEVR